MSTSFLESIKESCKDMIKEEVKKYTHNCELAIFERRIWMVEQQVKKAIDTIETEVTALRDERNQWKELYEFSKSWQIELEERVSFLEKQIRKDIL